MAYREVEMIFELEIAGNIKQYTFLSLILFSVFHQLSLQCGHSTHKLVITF